jgi:hypothetical protein
VKSGRFLLDFNMKLKLFRGESTLSRFLTNPASFSSDLSTSLETSTIRSAFSFK